MRKIIILMLCISLLFVGCSTQIDGTNDNSNINIAVDDIDTPKEIPEGFSEEFYNDMLVANELIEKSIAAKYIYINEEFDDEMMFYYYIIHKDSLTEEDKKHIKENQINIDKALTYKEEYIFNLLWDIAMNLFSYHVRTDDNELKKKIDDQYSQFKILLEIEEP